MVLGAWSRSLPCDNSALSTPICRYQGVSGSAAGAVFWHPILTVATLKLSNEHPGFSWDTGLKWGFQFTVCTVCKVELEIQGIFGVSDQHSGGNFG